MARSKPTNRYQFRNIRRQFTTPKTKVYESFADERKLIINKVFANNVFDTLGPAAKSLVLDSGHAITVKTMNDVGIPSSNITVPNINLVECEALRKHGVYSPHTTAEKCVVESGISHDAAWYDSMTSIGGRVDTNHYIGQFSNDFLKQNKKKIGHKCVIAVSVATRNRSNDCNIMSQKMMFDHQMAAIIAANGFVVDEAESHGYKKGMVFGMWNLTYNPRKVISKPKLLTWRRSKRLIGFPPKCTTL
jgi:hypothetical protein